MRNLLIPKSSVDVIKSRVQNSPKVSESSKCSKRSLTLRTIKVRGSLPKYNVSQIAIDRLSMLTWAAVDDSFAIYSSA